MRLLFGFILLSLALVGFGNLVSRDRQARADDARPLIDFQRQIRPILSENCFACHGPDEKVRKGRLRLDTREGAFGKLRGGGHAVVAGKLAESELIARITAQEPSQVMPPPNSGKTLKPEQVELLKQWIEQGASWSTHWAFTAPRKAALPGVKNSSWPQNSIDHFILARLEKKGLKPSPEADRSTLIRRVTLDLTGLPPTPQEVDAFLADSSPDAYEKVVDRLLQSPRHGEHQARLWLDVARYGDTHGLHLDNYREIWPYRDWVIRAFNRNMPYDRFVVEQLAGDLLPGSTMEQVVATGYNRCHISTNEGGSIEEEVYVRNVVDQVDTNGVVFMGLSVGCARCHDHRYDPISMKDYYQLFAFFNNIDGRAMDGNAAMWPPILKVPTPDQALALEKIQQKIDAIRMKMTEESKKITYDDSGDAHLPEDLPRNEFVWIEDKLPSAAKVTADKKMNLPWTFVTQDQPVHSGTQSVKLTAKGLNQVFFTEASPRLRIGEGDNLFAHVYLDPKDPPREIMLQWNSGDWKHRAYWGENLINFGKDNSPERLKIGPLPAAGQWVRLEVAATRVGLKPGMEVNGWAFTQFGGTAFWDKAGLDTKAPQGELKFDTLTTWLQLQRANGGANLPPPIQEIVKLDKSKRTEVQKKQLRDHFIEFAYTRTNAVFEPFQKELAPLDKERQAIDKKIPSTLVYKERPDIRPAFILKRGEYDQKGDKVERGTPSFLPPMPSGAPVNRLGFAQWLVAPDHPLTARVAVNRFWQQFFGTGIVKTQEDFGSQGEPPSHPELLDWLAVQFVEDGWNIQRMLKRIVTSATYRQSARITQDLLAKDPANRLLSRGPRFRLDAEMLRDQALFAGGLLVEKLGGPSVKPPQPKGIWKAVAFTGSNTGVFTPDTGPDKVHRRSMYTFWKRTAAPPQMTALDAPSREACTVRRERTNTPLQALMLMNEKQFVECARGLGERTMKNGGKSIEDKVKHMFKIAAARHPDARELAELLTLFNESLAYFQKNEKAAQQLIEVGETRPDPNLNSRELAAWTMLANLILNLDEVINRG